MEKENIMQRQWDAKGIEKNVEYLQNWVNTRKEIENLASDLQQISIEKLGRPYWAVWFQGQILDLSNQIKGQYDDCEKYVAYHALIGSTTDQKTSPKIDFPEPYSIKIQLENLINNTSWDEIDKEKLLD